MGQKVNTPVLNTKSLMALSNQSNSSLNKPLPTSADMLSNTLEHKAETELLVSTRLLKITLTSPSRINTWIPSAFALSKTQITTMSWSCQIFMVISCPIWEPVLSVVWVLHHPVTLVPMVLPSLNPSTVLPQILLARIWPIQLLCCCHL